MGPKTTLTTGNKYSLTLNKIQEHTHIFNIEITEILDWLEFCNLTH